MVVWWSWWSWSKWSKSKMERKKKYSIIYNIYIFIYYSVKMALPKIDFDQNDHDHLTTTRVHCQSRYVRIKSKKRQEKIRRPQWNIVTFAASRDECVTSTLGTQHFLSSRRKNAICPARKNTSQKSAGENESTIYYEQLKIFTNCGDHSGTVCDKYVNMLLCL